MEELQLTATAGDVDGAVEIMRETAQWLVDARMPLWEPENLTAEKLTNGLESDNFIVIKAGGEPAAAMILQWRDMLYWPMIGDDESGFIHKLCVRRKFAGHGLPRFMVDYAVEECRTKGIHFLRLDTDAGRPKLCGLYERLGFKGAGFVMMGKRIALYEMEL